MKGGGEDGDNNFIGGFPIQNLFGHKNNGEESLSKFTNLIIPSGLVIEKYVGDMTQKVYEATDGGCISDKMFDDLFGMVSDIKSKRKRGFTKKSRKIIKIASQYSKKRK